MVFSLMVTSGGTLGGWLGVGDTAATLDVLRSTGATLLGAAARDSDRVAA